MPVVVYLLWRELGPSCLVGVGFILIQPPLQYVTARFHTRLWYVYMYMANDKLSACLLTHMYVLTLCML